VRQDACIENGENDYGGGDDDDDDDDIAGFEYKSSVYNIHHCVRLVFPVRL